MGTTEPTHFDLDGKKVFVCDLDGTLIVGPTAENIEDKSDTRTTATGLEKIR